MKLSFVFKLFFVFKFHLFLCQLYGEFDSNFQNEINITGSIDFKLQSRGVLLYMSDIIGNKLIIKTGENFNETGDIIGNFNGLLFNLNSTNATYENIISLKIKLIIRNDSIFDFDSKILLTNIFVENNSSIESINFNKSENNSKKMMIWFGYNNYNNNKSLIKRNDKDNLTEMTGCINLFEINGHSIEIFNYDNNFYKSCYYFASETVCNNIDCFNDTSKIHRLNCSITLPTVESHCYREVRFKRNLFLTYNPIDNNQKNKNIKLIWERISSSNRCLIEIITKNDSVIVFHINKFSQIVTCIKWTNEMFRCSSEQLSNFYNQNDISVLVFGFHFSNLTVKIPQKEIIKTIFLPNFGYIEEINVGFSVHNKKCQRFNADIELLYNSNLFMLATKGTTDGRNYFKTTSSNDVKTIISTSSKPITYNISPILSIISTSSKPITNIISPILSVSNLRLLVTWNSTVFCLLLLCFIFLFFKIYQRFK